MRLLDPFAGYSLAKGIAVGHVALFIASFSVYWYSTIKTVDDLTVPDTVIIPKDGVPTEVIVTDYDKEVANDQLNIINDAF